MAPTQHLNNPIFSNILSSVPNPPPFLQTSTIPTPMLIPKIPPTYLLAPASLLQSVDVMSRPVIKQKRGVPNASVTLPSLYAPHTPSPPSARRPSNVQSCYYHHSPSPVYSIRPGKGREARAETRDLWPTHETGNAAYKQIYEHTGRRTA